MPAPSYTYTLTNGTTADATQVMQNFNDILNGVSDGTKDLSVNALTCAGTATLNGAINLGNASSDDITVTGSLASTLPIKTTNSYDIGSSTIGLRALYFGANSQTVNLKGSSSMSATWTMTLPTSAGTAYYVLKTDGSGNTSWVPPAPSAASGSDTDTTLTVSSARTQVITPTANRTYTLPTTSVLAGDVFTFINNASVSSSDLKILVNSSGGNLVRTVYAQTTGSVMALQDTPTTAAHWMGLEPVASNWTSFTPTGSWSSNVTYTGAYKRVGDELWCRVNITCSGAPTSAALTITLPLSLTIDTAKIPGFGTDISPSLGTIICLDAGTMYYHARCIYHSSTTVGNLVLGTAGTYANGTSSVDATTPFTFGSSDQVLIEFKVPISGWSIYKS